MSTINKPWGYNVSMETLCGYCGNDLYFSARSTGGDSSDSLIVSMPTDKDSLILLIEWANHQLNEAK